MKVIMASRSLSAASKRACDRMTAERAVHLAFRNWAWLARARAGISTVGVSASCDFVHVEPRIDTVCEPLAPNRERRRQGGPSSRDGPSLPSFSKAFSIWNGGIPGALLLLTAPCSTSFILGGGLARSAFDYPACRCQWSAAALPCAVLAASTC